MSKAFWDGFWFGLNPLNSLKVVGSLWRELLSAVRRIDRS